jgi:acyl carrier protein
LSAPERSDAMPNPQENTPLNGHEVDAALVHEIAGLIVSALNLDVAQDAIDPDAPLYKEGLGLDSIDILEVALVVSKRYGFKLKDDDQDNVRIFRSLASLAAHVAQRRTK